MNESMTKTIAAEAVQGRSKSSLGKMWAYFLVWTVFIALGVFCMANCDRGTVKTTASEKIEKKVTKNNKSVNDNRLANK